MHRALASATLLALVGVSCGGNDPQALLDAAPDALDRAGSSRFEMETLSLAPEGEASSVSAEGVLDLDTGDLEMDLDLGDELSQTTARVVDGELYLKGELFGLLEDDGDEVWFRFPERGGASGAASIAGSGQGGPTLPLELMRVAEEVEELGQEDVGGVPTTHLRARVSLDEAAAELPDDLAEQLVGDTIAPRARGDGEDGDFPDAYTVEVWLDDDALPRRLRTLVEFPLPEDQALGELGGELGTELEGGLGGGAEGAPPAEAPTITQDMTTELSDFGVDLDIEAPDPDNVREAPGGGP